MRVALCYRRTWYVRLYAFDEGCSISFYGDGDGDGSDDDGQLFETDDIIKRCG